MSDGDDISSWAIADKRRERREPVHDPARLVVKREGVVEALIVDRSLKGMRLRVPHSLHVGSTLTALDLNRFLIHQVKVIWKAGPDIGVELQSSFDVRSGQDADATTMRRLWFEATARR